MLLVKELDKTNPVIQDHMRELAQQYGGESAAMKYYSNMSINLHL